MARTDERVMLNFDCQWCGMPFRRLSAPIIPCPLCGSEHGPENGYPGPSDWEESDEEYEARAERDYWASVDRENYARAYAEDVTELANIRTSDISEG